MMETDLWMHLSSFNAGTGAEVTGSTGDIWSHKWVLDGGA